MMVRGTHVLFAGATGRAGAAADPRIDGDFAANNGAVGVPTCGFDDSSNFVPKREWQSAVFGDVEAFIAAEREIAVLHVQIRMAHSAAGDADQNLGAARRRTVRNRFAQRLPISDKRLAAKLAHAVLSPKAPVFSIVPSRPRATSSMRASRTNCSTETSSARAVGSSPAAAMSSAVSLPNERKLCRSILRRWPKAACVTASSMERSQGSGADRGTSRTTEDFTLGGGTNADAFTSKTIRGSQRHCTNTDKRP